MSQEQDVARFRQHGLRHHERARAGERQRDDPVEGALEHRAPGHPEDAGVEALVEVHESLERLVVGPVDHLSDRVADLAQRGYVVGHGSALGGEPGRGALEHAAKLDRVTDVGLGELAHDVPAGAQAEQQALVLERRQRQAQRRPRHAQSLHQPQLRHTLPRRKLTAQDQLAQTQQCSRHLGLAVSTGHLSPSSSTPRVRRGASLVRVRDCMQNVQSNLLELSFLGSC